MKMFAKILHAFVAVSLFALASGASAENRRVWLLNDTSFTVVKFHASNTSRTKWEEDILGFSTIESGVGVRVNIDDNTGACRFDTKVVFEGGSTKVSNDVDVCTKFRIMASGNTSVSSSDRRVWILNASSKKISRFHASNTGRTSWEEDILGSSTIPGNVGVRVNLDDGTGACRFDLKVVFSDGASRVEENFNVCEKVYWSVYD
jgi:hypothetical protein